MKFRVLKVLCAASLVVAAAGGFVGASNAATYNLTTDYSDANNPNGAWSYIYAGNPLPHQNGPASNGNAFNAAIPAGGYFALGNNTNNDTPWVVKAAVNGSSAGGNNGDFLAGDILIHSPNANGTALNIVWTAPAAGTVSNFVADVWYAHSTVNRSDDVTLYVNGVQQGSTFTVTNASNPNRSNPGTISLLPFMVLAGDTIALEFLKTSGQGFGSLNGVRESFTFDAAVSPVPLPAALPLFATVLAGGGLAAWRRKRKAAVVAATD
jgi:hypothetical protein